MSRGRELRVLVKQRLSAAAEQILELFERTIAEYEEEVSRLRQRNLTQLRTLEESTGVQIRSEPSHIKEEPEEEQLQELPFSPVCDESRVLHQRPAARTGEESNGADSEEDQLKGMSHSSRSYASGSDMGVSKPFRCSECGKEFQRKEYLRHHSIVHTGERPFCCPFCLKCFNQQGNLRTHIRIHTGEKPYSCSVCQRCFRDRGTLSKHMTTHTEQRPFSCTVCGKGFKQKGNLKGHMRTHTGDKPYSCPVCGKEFANMNCRNTHTRIHTGEKPFSCSVCTKQFSDLSNLSHHEKTHRK